MYVHGIDSFKKDKFRVKYTVDSLIMLVLNSAIQPLHIKLREYKIANTKFLSQFH